MMFSVKQVVKAAKKNGFTKAEIKRIVKYMTAKSAFSITIGNRAENGIGMQMIGDVDVGSLNYRQLKRIRKRFKGYGYETHMIRLHEALDISVTKEMHAYVLVVKNGVSEWCNPDDFLEEQKHLEHDRMALFRGEVKNKNARWNLCYGYFDQEPDYEEGKGRVIHFDHLPHTNAFKCGIEDICDFDRDSLVAELNYYYNVDECGIGPHGDKERELVICARLGSPFPMAFHWYHRWMPVGRQIDIELEHGDIYFMSEKAVGSDWKRSSIYTLRHAAGCNKYVKFIPPKSRR